MNSIERVWKRMKEAAVKLAHRKTAITMRESEDTVRKLCRQEKATAPPQDALEFLAEELMRLTWRRSRPRLTSRPPKSRRRACAPSVLRTTC